MPAASRRFGSVANAASNGNLYNFAGLLQYVVGVYGSTGPAAATPPFPVVAVEKARSPSTTPTCDSKGNPVALNPNWPTFVIIPGLNGYSNDFGSLAAAIAADASSFPNGQVNVLIATWQGSTGGPTIDGVNVPWIAALHVNTAGTDLGDILDSLASSSPAMIVTSTTTVIGEGLGVYVGDVAAQRAGGLENAIALNSETRRRLSTAQSP